MQKNIRFSSLALVTRDMLRSKAPTTYSMNHQASNIKTFQILTTTDARGPNTSIPDTLSWNDQQPLFSHHRT